MDGAFCCSFFIICQLYKDGRVSIFVLPLNNIIACTYKVRSNDWLINIESWRDTNMFNDRCLKLEMCRMHVPKMKRGSFQHCNEIMSDESYIYDGSNICDTWYQHIIISMSQSWFLWAFALSEQFIAINYSLLDCNI